MKHFFYASILTIILRLLYIGFFIDLHNDYYWEYGEIAKNVLAGKGYSFYYFVHGEREFHYSQSSTPLPSAYMPPGYVFFLVPYLALTSIVFRNVLLLSTHLLIVLFTLYFIFQFSRAYFSNRIATISVYLFALLPDFIYAVSSFTPLILIQCISVLLIFVAYKLEESTSVKTMVALAFLCFLLIFLKSDFIVFTLLLVCYWIIRKSWKKAILLCCVTALLQLPWIGRNYFTFREFVPLTTNYGLNLYRGNNLLDIGAWPDAAAIREEQSLIHDVKFEINLDKLYQRYAGAYISDHPSDVLLKIPKKIFGLWVYTVGSDKSSQWWYRLYGMTFFIAMLIGVYFSRSTVHVFAYMFFLYCTLIAVVFFTIPRYQTIMRIIAVPFVAEGISFTYQSARALWKSYKKK